MTIYFGIISLVICTFCGYRLSLKFSERRKFFVDFYNFNEKLINEVSFSQKSLLSLCDSEDKSASDFGLLINKTIKGEEYTFPTYLKNSDKLLFNEFGEAIGKSDKVSQLNFLSSKRKEISDIKDICYAEEKKYKKLYVKLGVLFGLIFLIMSL